MIIAQIENYNFEGYRQAEVVFRGLSINPIFNAGLGGVNVPDRLDAKTNRLFGMGDADYFRSVNLPDKQAFLNIDGVTRYLRDGTSRDSIEKVSNNFSQNLGLDYRVDYYSDYDRMFLGFEVNANAGWRYDREKEQRPSIQNIDRFDYRTAQDIIIGFRWGWGRLENISNAWHSYRILNRLSYIDRLKGIPTVDQINAFGQYLDEIKAYRIFDSRLRDVALLQYIDGYLRDELGLEASDIKYFSELNDMYQFGVTARRLKGMKITLQPSVGLLRRFISAENRTLLFEGEQVDHLYGGQALLNWFYGKPINRDWQLNLEAQTAIHFTWIERSRSGDIDYDEKYRTIGLTARFTPFLAYYPTTRTQWILRGNFQFQDGLLEEITPVHLLAHFTADLSFSYRYFFSPYTSFNVGLRVSTLQGSNTQPLFLRMASEFQEDRRSGAVSFRIGMSHFFF